MRPGLTAMTWRRYADCARLNGRVVGLLARGRWMRSSDIARSYDALAPDYDRAWLVHLQDTTARLLDRIPGALPEGPILDLGCGTGFAALRLALRFPGRAVEACDLSAGMIAEARRRPGAEAVAWSVADMAAFLAGRPAGSAALAVAAWSAGYADLRHIARDCARVLRPGGRFALVVNLADTLAPLRRAFRHTMQARAADLQCLARFPFPRDAAAVRAALHAAGLRAEHFEEGACAIEPPPSADGRRLPWLLRTGTLAGFDAMLPLDRPGPVADTFEARLAADPEPIRHHYALAVAERP
ncbi:MAG: methyltransferase domain-containing protein [Lentisphaerae bacterium]|nr:methyltransferase domain-containing protein [Lentisphaerota bacterium]